MADKTLASGNNNDTVLNTIYTAPSNQSVSLNPMTLINKSANTITVSVYFNDGTDRGPIIVKIPKGAGNTLTVLNMPLALSASFSLKIQSSSTDSFDYVLTGSEG